jgi:hypothetical protein
MNSNDYKYKNFQEYMNKKGQVAVFIIIALVIIAVFVFLIFLRRGPSGNETETFNPEAYLEECIEPSVKENIEKLSLTGGYANPEGTMTFNGQEYKYLCYISEDYKPCIVQQPLLKEQFEMDLNSLTRARAQECANELKEEYESRGYEVTSKINSVEFSILPDIIRYYIDGTFNIRKDDEVRNYDGFKVDMDSKLYDLLLISISIIDFESTYGDSETTEYIQYYPDLKIEKIRLSEGSKIYRVSDVVTLEQFNFATRSLVFPPGYGLQ